MFQSKGTLAYSHLWKQFYKANWQGKITLNFTFYQFALRGMPFSTPLPSTIENDGDDSNFSGNEF